MRHLSHIFSISYAKPLHISPINIKRQMLHFTSALRLYPFNSHETELDLVALHLQVKYSISDRFACKEPVPVFPRNCHSLSSKRS